MTELLNMDLSHPPVPADQWARQSPAWSQPYTQAEVFTRPGYTTRPGTPMTAIVPVAAVSMTKVEPEPVTTTNGKAAGFSNKLVIGAIAMGLVMGVSALLLLTSGVDKRSHATEVAAAPTQTAQPTQAAQVEQPKPAMPVPPAAPAVNARSQATVDVPVSTLVAVVDGSKEKPADKPKTSKTTRVRSAGTKNIVKTDKPAAPPSRGKTKTKESEADVASSRALLAQANEESTLR